MSDSEWQHQQCEVSLQIIAVLCNISVYTAYVGLTHQDVGLVSLAGILSSALELRQAMHKQQ